MSTTTNSTTPKKITVQRTLEPDQAKALDALIDKLKVFGASRPVILGAALDAFLGGGWVDWMQGEVDKLTATESSNG